MPVGMLAAVGTGYSVTVPAVVTLPILFVADSVNHRLPSGPATMPFGELAAVGTAYSVTVPVGVIVPILFAPFSVNHRLPSGPAVMSQGEAPAVMPVENSVKPLTPSGIVAIVE